MSTAASRHDRRALLPFRGRVSPHVAEYARKYDHNGRRFCRECARMKPRFPRGTSARRMSADPELKAAIVDGVSCGDGVEFGPHSHAMLCAAVRQRESRRAACGRIIGYERISSPRFTDLEACNANRSEISPRQPKIGQLGRAPGFT